MTPVVSGQRVALATNRWLKSSSSRSVVARASSSQAPAVTWKVKMLYDGDCPLCMREVNMLRKRDEGKGNICFVDIASPDYKPEENENVTFEQSMERIHAIFPNGDIVTDIQAFKAFYEQVGLGWVYAATDIPLVANALNAVYGIWAKYRLPITGRPDLGVILQEKSMCKKRTNE